MVRESLIKGKKEMKRNEKKRIETKRKGKGKEKGKGN